MAKQNGRYVVVNFLEGRSHIKMIKKFVHEDLARAHRALDSRALEEVQKQLQGNLQRYAVGVLRSSGRHNHIMYDIGSAPISQATDVELP